MDFKNFFAGMVLFNTNNKNYFVNCMFRLKLNSGSLLSFIVNPGICPEGDSRFTVYKDTLKENVFEICDVTRKNRDNSVIHKFIIEKMGKDFEGELPRLTLSEVNFLIEHFGGIDIEETMLVQVG